MDKILIIILFSLMVYFRTLKFLTITDDIKWYAKHKDGWGPIKNYGWRIHHLLRDRLYGACTFLNVKWHFNKNVEIDHLFSIFLHTLICVMLYIATGSFFGAILYCCHPLANQTSMWLNGRRYAVNIILVLASWISWQHHLWYLSIPMWGFTSMFHMTALFAPVLWGCWWLMLAIIPYWIFNREKIKNQILSRLASIHSKELLIFWPRRVIVVVKSYGFYFWKIIFPTTTLMYYPELQFWGVTTEGNKDAYSFNKHFYFGVSALLLTLAGIIALSPSDRPLAIFAALAVVQWCNIVYAVSTLADRYANMGLVFAMPLLVRSIDRMPPELATLVLGGFIGYYLMSLTITMRMYSIIWDQYKYHIWRSPESLSGRIFLANFHIKKQEFVNAWPIVEEGLKYHPNDFLLLYQAAQCWKGIGNPKMAKQFLTRAGENFYEAQDTAQRQALVDFIL